MGFAKRLSHRIGALLSVFSCLVGMGLFGMTKGGGELIELPALEVRAHGRKRRFA
jgi:hypothetical protein